MAPQLRAARGLPQTARCAGAGEGAAQVTAQAARARSMQGQASMPRLRFLPEQRTSDFVAGDSILTAALRASVPHVHACGGHARCSTCRVQIVEGLEHCPPRGVDEAALAERLHFAPEVRMACQTRPTGDVTARRLVLDQEDLEIVMRSEQLAGGSAIGEEIRLVLLLADVRGFTSFAEDLLPYDVVHALNRYFTAMGKLIEQHGGLIDNYMGDGLLALFGLQSGTNAALRAVQAGLAMLRGVDELAPYFTATYGRRFDIGVGIHVGTVVRGAIGAHGSRRVSVIGDPVNHASRIEAMNKELQTRLLVSGELLAEVRDQVELGRSASVMLRGKHGVYAVHEIRGLKA